MTNVFAILLCIVACIAQPAPSHGIFLAPELAPVDRLLSKAQAHRDAHPGEAAAHYTLARIHYLAFSSGEEQVPAMPADTGEGAPAMPPNWIANLKLYEARQKRALELALKDVGERGPRVPPEKASALEEARGRRARQLEEQNWQPRGDLPAPKMFAHAAAALSGFREAARLDPKNGLYPLGLGCLAEDFSTWSAGRKDIPKELRPLDLSLARTAYLHAFRLAITGEAALPGLPLGGIASLVSHEAGSAYLRIIERERRKLTADERAAVTEVKSGLQKLKSIPMGAITPVIFSMKHVASVEALLAGDASVNFDLRGYGPAQRWPWVGPSTGFLVWDPQASGEIRSAGQLFGSYSFEIFWRTGYEALGALDDDGNGTLQGAELRGIRAWFDANSDGRSEPCEVRDLCELGIEAISTNATGRDGAHPANPHGLTLRDGGTLPTWDWIAEPLR